MIDKLPNDQRCAHTFERRGKGMRYVYARWRCKRKKLKGSEYCSYCEPRDEKLKRLASKADEAHCDT